MNLLYKKLKKKKLTFQHVCEVGVYKPETSNVLDFITDGTRTTLVEADPVMVELLSSTFAPYKVQIVPYAMWDYNGTIILSQAGASTFVDSLPNSPALENDGYIQKAENSIEVECKVFSAVDDGSIDLLSIDIEGGEWYVLKHAVSRPAVISVETHGKFYVNPYLQQLEEWFQINNYRVWYKDASDTVYIRNGLFTPTFWERLTIVWRELRIRLRRLRKH